MTTATWPTMDEVTGCEDVEACLRWNRFLPGPMNDDQVAIINAVVRRLGILRSRDNDAYVRASKNLGWGS